jgi:putative Ig domain-containing protein
MAPPTTITSNSAPTIEGNGSGSIRAGSDYQFQPDWADGDGDSLTFTAVNLPPWATLDPKTGRISGTPGNSDIGAYEAVAVMVADATHQVSTQEFTITVTGVGSGVASLSWQRSNSKVDGSVLDDLAGYRILYGRDPEDLDHSVYLANPDAVTYDFATLESGAWYFAVIAVDAFGLEGPATVPAMKVI